MKRSIYIIILIILIIIILGAVFITLQEVNSRSKLANSQVTNSSDPVSYIYSLNSSISSSQSVDFPINIKLKQPSIDNTSQYTNHYINFNSDILSKDNIEIKKIDDGTVTISSSKFSVLIFLNSEGITFGINTPIPGNIKVNSRLEKPIYRVDANLNDNVKKISNRYFSSPYLYYYTDDFNLENSCGKNLSGYYCGSTNITLRNGLSNNTIFSAYCGVQDKQYISQCDEFINNLILN